MEKTLVTLALAGVLSACGNYHEVKDGVEGSQGKPGSSTLDFATLKAEIFTPHCVSCHRHYATYASVQREISAIFSSVSANRMPKNQAPLSEAKKALLAAWIASGSPEVPGEEAPRLPPELEPTWASVSQNILFPKCVACHNPQGQAKFLDLSTRQALFDQRDREFGGDKLLQFERPEESYLMTVIKDEVEPMPPLSSNIPLLTGEEIRVLEEWIGLGLP